MTRDSFIFYRSFYEAINELDDKTQLQTYKAIAEFSLDSKESELTGLSKTIFTLIKPQLEANNKRYLNGIKPKNKSKTEAKVKQKVSKSEANKNKNVNKNKNKNDNNNEIIEVPFFVDVKCMGDFIQMRKDIKAELTENAYNLLINKLLKFHNDGHDVNEILNESTMNNYKGVFAPKQSFAKPKKKDINFYVNEAIGDIQDGTF